MNISTRINGIESLSVCNEKMLSVLSVSSPTQCIKTHLTKVQQTFSFIKTTKTILFYVEDSVNILFFYTVNFVKKKKNCIWYWIRTFYRNVHFYKCIYCVEELGFRNGNNENMNVDFWKQVYVFKDKIFFKEVYL